MARLVCWCACQMAALWPMKKPVSTAAYMSTMIRPAISLSARRTAPSLLRREAARRRRDQQRRRCQKCRCTLMPAAPSELGRYPPLSGLKQKTPSGILVESRRNRARPLAPAAQAGPSRLRYPWLRLHVSGAQWAAGLVALAAGIALAFLYSWYLQSSDAAADSIYGLGFGVAGTLLLLLVGSGYTLRKRWGRPRASQAKARKTGFRKRPFRQGARWPGLLHTFLAWHMAGGLLGLLLIWMHTANS